MTISISSALWAFVPHEDWYVSWHLLCKAVLGHSWHTSLTQVTFGHIRLLTYTSLGTLCWAEYSLRGLTLLKTHVLWRQGLNGTIPGTSNKNLVVQILNGPAVLAKRDGVEGISPDVTGASLGIFLRITTTQGLPCLNTSRSMWRS